MKGRIRTIVAAVVALVMFAPAWFALARLRPLAGIKVGDKLVAVDGLDARDAPVFGDSKPGTVHRVAVRRGDEVLEVTFQATTRPEKTPSAEEYRAKKDAG